MKVSVRNLDNESIREVDLPDEVFRYPYKEHLIHAVVVALRAAGRSGSHKTKGRSEVVGSGRKFYRQKGTGRARVGTIRSPLARTGGTVHGPRPRSHAQRLSAREKRNALRSALSRKLAEDQLLVLDSLDLESHRTAELERRLAAIGIAGRALVVDGRDNENLRLASRNNRRIKAVDPLGVNVYDLVDRPHVVISESALGRLVEVLRR